MASLVGLGYHFNRAVEGTSVWVARHIRKCAKPHRGLAGCICGPAIRRYRTAASRPTANTGNAQRQVTIATSCLNTRDASIHARDRRPGQEPGE